MTESKIDVTIVSIANAFCSIIEGCATVVFGLVAAFVLPDYPTTTTWLSEREVFIAEKRMIDDAGVADDDEDNMGVFVGIRLALTDPKVWLLAIIYHATIMGLSFRYTTFFSPYSWFAQESVLVSIFF